VPVRVGSVRVPVFVIDDMTGAVSVLLVSVSVPASVANVPVTIGNVIVGVPATAGATIVAVPEVLPGNAAPVTPNVVVPAIFAVVPTNNAFATPTPPAVMIEPVAVLVASVTRLLLMPAANGILAVVVVCPSLVIAVDKPVPRSAVKALKGVDAMTVPVTTGWPELLMIKVPEPL
jgi:hypothetical protein